MYDVRFRNEEGTQFKKTFKTKKAALEYNANLTLNNNTNDFRNSRESTITLKNYSNAWLEAKIDLRLRTLEQYSSILKLHILPRLGNYQLVELNTPIIRNWYNSLIIKGLSRSTAAKCYRLIRTILNSAIDDGMLKLNPCKIKGAGVDKSCERPVATIQEIFKLAEQIDERYRLVILLASFACLRLGEILALETSSVDIENMTVSVTKQVQELADGKNYFSAPKTDAGIRKVSLPGFMKQEILDHLTNFVSSSNDSLLFSSSTGNPIRRKVLYRSWDTARQKVGLDHLHFHDLRHSGNTLAAQTGATTKELMNRMGHSSSVAALRYQHANFDRDKLIATKIDSMVNDINSD